MPIGTIHTENIKEKYSIVMLNVFVTWNIIFLINLSLKNKKSPPA